MLLQAALIAAFSATCSCYVLSGISSTTGATTSTGAGQSPLHITTRAFSGVHDSSWIVQPSDSIFQNISSALQSHTSDYLPAILGYRGIEVQDEDALHVNVTTGSNYEFEVLLLTSGLSSGDPEIVDFVQELLCQLTSEEEYCGLSTSITATSISSTSIPSTSSTTSSSTISSITSSTSSTNTTSTSSSSASSTSSTITSSTSSSIRSSTSSTTTSSISSSTRSSTSSTTTPSISSPTTSSISSTTTPSISSSTTSSTSSATTPSISSTKTPSASSTTTTSTSSTTTPSESSTSSVSTPSTSLSTTPSTSSTTSSSTSSTKASSSTSVSSTSTTIPSTQSTDALSSSSSSTYTSTPETTDPTSLSSTPPSIPPSSTPDSSTNPTSTKKPCKCPKYRPGKWNNNQNTRENNNCYNYATNSKTGTFAQPGRGTGGMYGSLTGPAVQAAAVSDGLKNQGNPGPGKFPETDDCLVALVIWPGRDFHWYRQDKNGNWSHKPGQTPATNLDNSGNVITDPRTADLGPYQFVCFMSYCPKDITVNK